MEASGFKVRLDLSQFFSDIKKFSCIYVDLSRDRQIADVVDRISELFGTERPLFLLDERFYLPESENVNILRGSNIVKVLKAFNFQYKESHSTTDHLTNGAKGVEYLGHEIDPVQVSIKSNKTDTSENSGYLNSHQNGKVDSSVSHTDTETFQELRGKKRKHKEIDESKCTNDVNIVQQNIEPEIYYQKKCKRKKERVKKEVLNDSSLEPIEDELEEKNSDDTYSDSKNNRKKKRNKARQIKGDVTDEKLVSGLLNHNSLEHTSDPNEQATCDSRGLKKHKKKRKEDIASLDRHEIDSVPLHSTDLKKRKKKNCVIDTKTDMVQDQNIDSLVNRGIENCDNIQFADSDFAHIAVSSTPTVTDEYKITEVTDFQLQENANIHEFPEESLLEQPINALLGEKPKRKRVRVRKRKKRSNIQNDSVVSLPSVVPNPVILQSTSKSFSKHIRFTESLSENLEENTSNKELGWDSDKDVGNNTYEEMCNSVASSHVNAECTNELSAETEATNCHLKSSIENAIPEKLKSKDNAMSLLHQIALHQQWALNTVCPNLDTKESLQKLLILGKQSTVPVVFERKKQCNNPESASESLTPVSKQENNKTAEETCFQNTSQVEELADKTCPKTNPNTIDPLSYPRLEGKPKKNDIIAFKILKLTSNYTPEISGFIIGTVLSICEDTLELLLQIEVGESDLKAPKGKFSLEIEGSEKNDDDSKLRQMNWNELMDVRILFP